MSFCPAIAYPLSIIDPLLDDETRDDGEVLLKRLRPVWRSLERKNAALLDPESDHSISKMILNGSTATDTEKASIISGLLDNTASTKPIVRLIAPSTALLSPETMDQHMTNAQRVMMVPVKDDRRCAVLNWPADMRPVPKIVLVFEKELFCKEAIRNAEVSIVRSGATLDIQISSFAGGRKRVKAVIQDGRILDYLFDTTGVSGAVDTCLVPTVPNELPASLMINVADFWQSSLRAHVLTAACQPCDNKSSRFLSFSRMTVKNVGKDEASKKIVLTAQLHPSSAECVCCVHNSSSVQSQNTRCNIVGSKVEFQLSMCGHKLHRPVRGMQFGICPIHQGSTPNVSMFPDICCKNTTAEISCTHFTDKQQIVPGLRIRNIPLQGADVLQAQAIIVNAMECAENVGPLLGKRNHDGLKELCSAHAQRLSSNLEAVERLKACREEEPNPSELMELDIQATALLRERKVRQLRRPTTKQLVLARPKAMPDGSLGAMTPLKRPEADLNQKHIWLFAPPIRY